MKIRETESEYRDRKKRFEAARAEVEFYLSGLGRLLPDAAERLHAATQAMWDNANAPSDCSITHAK
jgi:hypothetical protein